MEVVILEPSELSSGTLDLTVLEAGGRVGSGTQVPKAGQADLLLLCGDEPETILADGARLHLRPFEPCPAPDDWSLPDGGLRASLVVVSTPRGEVGPSVEVLRLGRRRVRSALEAREALLYVVAGELVARATDEELPFELEAGEALWIRAARRGEELELSGRTPDCVGLLVELHRLA